MSFRRHLVATDIQDLSLAHDTDAFFVCASCLTAIMQSALAIQRKAKYDVL